MNPTALAVFAFAVASFEGQPGDRNWRNRNPGNLKFADQHHATGKDPAGFAIFDTFEHGFQALQVQIAIDARRDPEWTIADFVNSYAPPADNNPNNAAYAERIASLFGLTPKTPLARALETI